MNRPADHPARVSAGAVHSAREDYPTLARVTEYAPTSFGAEAGQALDEIDLLRAAILLATDATRTVADLLEQKIAGGAGYVESIDTRRAAERSQPHPTT